MDITERAEAKMEIIKFQGNEKYMTCLVKDVSKYYIVYGLLDKIKIDCNSTDDYERIDNLIQFGPATYSCRFIAPFLKGKENSMLYYTELNSTTEYDTVTKILETIL